MRPPAQRYVLFFIFRRRRPVFPQIIRRRFVFPSPSTEVVPLHRSPRPSLFEPAAQTDAALGRLGGRLSGVAGSVPGVFQKPASSRRGTQPSLLGSPSTRPYAQPYDSSWSGGASALTTTHSLAKTGNVAPRRSFSDVHDPPVRKALSPTMSP